MTAPEAGTSRRTGITPAALLCSTLLAVAPMAAPVLVPVLGLSLIPAYTAAGLRLDELARAIAGPSRVFAGLSLLGVYLFVNAFWSPVPAFAFRVAGFYFFLGFTVLLALRTIPQEGTELTRRWSRGICAGLALGSLVLLFEVLTDQTITRLLMSYAPILLDSRHAVLKDGWVVQLPAFRPNRSALVLALCLWPVLLNVFAVRLDRWKRVAIYAALLAGVVAVALSDHETSKLALVGSALVFLTGRFSLTVARWLVVAGWLVATALAVPLANYAYSEGLHRASWLPYSARDRVVIWQFTAERIAHAPVLGTGIGAARTSALEEKGKVAPDTALRRRLSWHSHNAYLQIWFETGAVGAGLLLGAGLLIICAIGAAPLLAQPYLYAAFAACALAAATSYSIWAPWFMACLALVPMLAAMGIGLLKGDNAPDTRQRRQ